MGVILNLKSLMKNKQVHFSDQSCMLPISRKIQ